jgi:hypothetical protein
MSSPFSFTTDSTCPFSVFSSLSLQPQFTPFFYKKPNELNLCEPEPEPEPDFHCHNIDFQFTKEGFFMIAYLATSARRLACSAISESSL